MLAGDIGTFVRNKVAELQKTADGLKLASSVSVQTDPFRFLGKSGMLADYLNTEPSFLVLRALDRDGQGSYVAKADGRDPTVEHELASAYTSAMRGQVVVGDAIRTELFPDGGFVVAVPVVVPPEGTADRRRRSRRSSPSRR